MRISKKKKKKSALFPHGAGGGLNGKKASTERERGASRLFFVSSLFSSETISRSSAMNSLLIFRFRALSIGSLLFLSSLRARDWKKKKKCGESLFAFAPFWGRSAKKKFYDTHDKAAKTEKKKSEEMGAREAKDSKQRTCLLAVL